MASNLLPPIPQDKIGETHKWREWFFNLGTYISVVQGVGGIITHASLSSVLGNGQYHLSLTERDKVNNDEVLIWLS